MNYELHTTRSYTLLRGTLPDSGRHVEITVEKPTTRFGAPSEARVNWSSLGAVSNEDAAAYGALLLQAAGIARQLDYALTSDGQED